VAAAESQQGHYVLACALAGAARVPRSEQLHGAPRLLRAQFTSFASTKVQMLDTRLPRSEQLRQRERPPPERDPSPTPPSRSATGVMGINGNALQGDAQGLKSAQDFKLHGQASRAISRRF